MTAPMTAPMAGTTTAPMTGTSRVWDALCRHIDGMAIGTTMAALHERVKVAERALLVDTVGAMARGGWSVQGRKVKVGS